MGSRGCHAADQKKFNSLSYKQTLYLALKLFIQSALYQYCLFIYVANPKYVDDLMSKQQQNLNQYENAYFNKRSYKLYLQK